MILNEASEHFQISTDTLREYKEDGFLKSKKSTEELPEFNDSDIQRIALIGFLQKTGMDSESLKSYLKLLNEKSESKDEQIRMLKKQRCRLLEEIHEKQQILDELDYMIHKIKK